MYVFFISCVVVLSYKVKKWVVNVKIIEIKCFIICIICRVVSDVYWGNKSRKIFCLFGVLNKFCFGKILFSMK